MTRLNQRLSIRPVRRPGAPYLFSYDVRCPRRARQVLRCLRRWRLDGQLSVHETWLRPFEVQDLATELLELVDREADNLLACRLDQRGSGPIFQLFDSGPRSPVRGPLRPNALPRHLHDGWYLLTYDVADPKRLQRVQRATVSGGLFLQRSVYLFQGKGSALVELLAQVRVEMHPTEDDLRIYTLSSPSNLWFLSGDTPPLAGLGTAEHQTFWQRARRWFGLGN